MSATDTDRAAGGRGDRRGRGRVAVLDGALAGPEGHPRVGPRVRRERRPPRRRRVGREARRLPGRSIQEAAKIGLYGFEGIAQFWADPSGLSLPIVNEELFWGDAGIGMAIFGTTLAVAAHLRQGHARADGRVGPAVLRHRGRRQGRGVLRVRARRRLRRLGYRTTAKYDEAKDEWVLNGQKAWATNGGIANVHVVIATVDRELGSRGHAAFVIPPGHEGLRAGRQGQEARHPRLAHRRRPPRRLPHPGLVPAGRQGEARREARPRARGQERPRARPR